MLIHICKGGCNVYSSDEEWGGKRATIVYLLDANTFILGLNKRSVVLLRTALKAIFQIKSFA